MRQLTILTILFASVWGALLSGLIAAQSDHRMGRRSRHLHLPVLPPQPQPTPPFINLQSPSVQRPQHHFQLGRGLLHDQQFPCSLVFAWHIFPSLQWSPELGRWPVLGTGSSHCPQVSDINASIIEVNLMKCTSFQMHKLSPCWYLQRQSKAWNSRWISFYTTQLHQPLWRETRKEVRRNWKGTTVHLENRNSFMTLKGPLVCKGLVSNDWLVSFLELLTQLGTTTTKFWMFVTQQSWPELRSVFQCYDSWCWLIHHNPSPVCTLLYSLSICESQMLDQQQMWQDPWNFVHTTHLIPIHHYLCS